MLQAGQTIPDLTPWLPVIGGVLSALLTVVMASWFSRQRSQVRALRSIKSEIEYNENIAEELVTNIINEIEGSHLEEDIELPSGAELEISYIIALPGPLSTSSFDYMRQTGGFAHLPINIRERLFRHYNKVQKINNLLSHRDDFHFDKIENIYLEIRQSEESSNGEEESSHGEGIIQESDLPIDDQNKIQTIRELRRVMKRMDESILNQIAPLSNEKTHPNNSSIPESEVNPRDSEDQVSFEELSNYLDEQISNTLVSKLV